MRILLTLLLSLSSSANALSIGEQELIIKGVIKEAQDRHYADDDTKLAIQSNVFEIDDFMMCFYLPKLGDCK